MAALPEYFGSLVFDDRVMKANLSAEVYQSLRRTIDEDARLDIGVANAVASAMRESGSKTGEPHGRYTLGVWNMAVLFLSCK